MNPPIYLDHHATTPLDPRVLAAMMPFLGAEFGNPSSQHHYGWRAKKAVEKAREQVATLIGARPAEIVFTSGSTESNWAVITSQGGSCVSSSIEHASVLRNLTQTSVLVDPNSAGEISVAEVAAAIEPSTTLISVMFASHEIGTIQPVGSLADLAKERGIRFHCDATQGLGYVPFDVGKMPIDFASISAHKIYGPKGVGALFVSKRLPSNDYGFKHGTQNVAGIVGFGEACHLMSQFGHQEAITLAKLRDQFFALLKSELTGLNLNGAPKNRLPGNLNLTFSNLDGPMFLESILPYVALSTGAACNLGRPSHVLKAIGLRDEQISSTFRFGLGRFTTEDEIKQAAKWVVETAKRCYNEPWS